MKIKKEVVAAAQCVVEDLKMLQSGEWEPDAGSIQDSLDNAELVLAFLKEK